MGLAAEIEAGVERGVYSGWPTWSRRIQRGNFDEFDDKLCRRHHLRSKLRAGYAILKFKRKKSILSEKRKIHSQRSTEAKRLGANWWDGSVLLLHTLHIRSISRIVDVVVLTGVGSVVACSSSLSKYSGRHSQG